MYLLITFVWIGTQQYVYELSGQFSEMVCETLRPEAEARAKARYPDAFVAAKCYRLAA